MHLLNEINSLFAGRSRTTPSGWLSINCPACHHNGEPSPDTRHRGGIKTGFDGSISFNCLRCHFKAHWHPGISLSKKMQQFLLYSGMNYDEIKKLNFVIWRENQNIISTSVVKQDLPHNTALDFPKTDLPEGARPIKELINLENPPDDLIDVYEYLVNSRGDIITSSYDYYWSPEKKNSVNRSVIIPFYFKNKVVGYTCRRIDKKHKARYFSNVPLNFIFKNENLSKKTRKYIIVTEGPFDAIAVDGIAVLGGSINKNQINWINSSMKEIIVVPDRVKNGSTLVDIAQENGWWVSIPSSTGTPISEKEHNYAWVWHNDIKDCADAVKRYGRLFTIASILENKTRDKIKIELFKRMFLKE